MTDCPFIHTVLGPIKPEVIGQTLMHEHILCDFYRITGNLDHLLNDEQLAVAELSRLLLAGGSTIVEVTTPDMGRDPAGLQRIATKTGLNIVMGCGWYRQPYYPESIDRLTTAELSQQMVQELTTGIGDAGITAGIIGEIGVNLDYITAQEERVLRAAARAQKLTGAPLTTHASMYPVGLAQLDILADEGVDFSRVIIGHCDTYLNETYHQTILMAGAYVQFDTIGRRHMNPDERRADALVSLLAHGWEDKLLLSSDRCYRSDLFAFGGAGYDVVFRQFFQLLRERGVTEMQLDKLIIENPRAILAW